MSSLLSSNKLIGAVLMGGGVLAVWYGYKSFTK